MSERKPPGVSFESWVGRQIREAIRTPSDGPPVDLVPFDVERVVERWRCARDPRGA